MTELSNVINHLFKQKKNFQKPKKKTTSVIVQVPFLGKLTISTYSCYNSKLNPLPAGTIIAGSLGTSITNFCSTDNCNTGKATDTATLWCNLGVNGGPFNGLFKQSCTGQCGVRIYFSKLNLVLCIYF